MAKSTFQGSSLYPLLLLAVALGGCSSDARYAGESTPYSDYGAATATPTAGGTATPAPAPTGTPAPDSTPIPEETATPNPAEDAPCDDVSGEAFTLYMSADDSNSQADPAHARDLITSGSFVNSPLRMYEVYNYHSFDYPAPELGKLQITPQIRQVSDPTSAVPEFELVIGVTAPNVSIQDRKPYNLTFSLDTSGSMGGSAILNLKSSMYAIAGELREGDVVSMVSWSTEQNILLDSQTITGPNDPKLVSEIAKLSASGGTDLDSGLNSAYRLANKNRQSEMINRVVLMSDGGANVGQVSADIIALNARDEEKEGIYMVGVGMGSYASSYNDYLMDTITDLGKGAYLYIDSQEEADRVLTGDNLTSVLSLAAREVRLSVVIPAGFKQDKFFGEEISGDPREVQPQHLSPNDSMIYHLTLLDCINERNAAEAYFTFQVTWQDPDTYIGRTDSITLSLEDMLGDSAKELEKVYALTLYGKALTDVYEETSSQQKDYLTGIIAQIGAINLELADPELTDVMGLLETYKSLF